MVGSQEQSLRNPLWVKRSAELRTISFPQDCTKPLSYGGKRHSLFFSLSLMSQVVADSMCRCLMMLHGHKGCMYVFRLLLKMPSLYYYIGFTRQQRAARKDERETRNYSALDRTFGCVLYVVFKFPRISFHLEAFHSLFLLYPYTSHRIYNCRFMCALKGGIENRATFIVCQTHFSYCTFLYCCLLRKQI